MSSVYGCGRLAVRASQLAVPLRSQRRTLHVGQLKPELHVEKPSGIGQLAPPKRLLMGPGPGNAHPRVHAALALPQVGHMDAAFLKVCEELKDLLRYRTAPPPYIPAARVRHTHSTSTSPPRERRYVWQTKNAFTIPCSGTGSAAWEAAIANVTEPGDKHLTFVNGYFGERHCDMASRYGAEVVRVDKPWGEVFSLADVEAAIAEHKPQVVWMAHAETSTGARQPMDGIGDACRKHDALLMLDTVTSIAGMPVLVDEWQVDACYAGTQKCISCPPGVAPLTLGERALAKLGGRSKPVANWYLDMSMIQKYLVTSDFGTPRVYHHTAPISMVFAFREALQIVAEEGLENSWARHRDAGEFFWSELAKVGLEPHVAHEHRLPSLTTVKIPEDIDGAKVVTYLRENYDMEIAGGLGKLAGKVWRIGLMGYNAKRENALLCAAALNSALEAQRGAK